MILPPPAPRNDVQLRRVRDTAALGGALLYLTCIAGAQPMPPLAPLDVSEIAPGVYVHLGATAVMTRENEGAIANIGFVVGEEAVAVIDTGGSVREGERLLAAVRARTDKPIRYVINTHAHPDHVFGNAAFTGTAARFVGHRNLPRALASRGPHYLAAFRRSMGGDLIDPVRLVSPDRAVDGETSLALGGRTLTLRGWPVAHSDCDLTVIDDKSGILFAGDLVFREHVPVLDGSLNGWLAVLDELARVPARRVVPGHGRPAAWPQALEAQRAYLQRLAADVRGAIRQGVGLAPASAAAARSEKSHWALFEEYNARNATAAYSELEWE